MGKRLFDDDFDDYFDEPLQYGVSSIGRSRKSYTRRALPEQCSRRPNLTREGSTIREAELSEGVSYTQPMLDEYGGY